jgi:hypothetical protein
VLVEGVEQFGVLDVDQQRRGGGDLQVPDALRRQPVGKPLGWLPVGAFALVGVLDAVDRREKPREGLRSPGAGGIGTKKILDKLSGRR